MRRRIKRMFDVRAFNYYRFGKSLLMDPDYLDGQSKSKLEKEKRPKRTDVLNFLLEQFDRKTHYLEIGVRNPEDNFVHVRATTKYSVDPGYEYDINPVDFQMTSDEFFQKLDNSEVLSNDIRFDLIFIDGLHLAFQVDRDIQNALRYIKDDGFIVLHDCNPPTEWHAREEYNYRGTPAGKFWNGTTWKAFLKWRFNTEVNSCCIDTDWGVGVISKSIELGGRIKQQNEFFEYHELDSNRKELLNLLDFGVFKSLISG